MKNKHILQFILSLVMLVVVSSCKKYLEKKSDTSLVSPTTLIDMQGMLDDFYTMNSLTPSFGEASADDYFLLSTTYNAQSQINQKAYTWSVDVYNYPNDWAYGYNPVYNANYCLEQVERVARTEQNKNAWDNVKGSALFYRAYYFLNLAWVFAKNYDAGSSQTDMGIVLRLAADFNLPSKRSNVQETYNQIISDLDAAHQYLPATPLHTARPSRAASFALLARTYLCMGKYDSAYKYSDLALQVKSDLLDYNDANEINPASTAPFKPFNKEVIFFTTMSNVFSVKNPGIALVDSLLYAGYNNNDIRKTVFFRTSGLYRRFKGSYAASPSILFSGIAVDEVYLIRAECNARAGRVTQAMNDLNALLEKRWVASTFIPISAVSQQEAVNTILEERRKELLMRGLRWSDIKRLNAEGRSISPKRLVGSEVYQLQPREKRYALPLPNDIINLTGMQQN